MKKRGISPLIGSVLLIAFVIILFVSITMWVRQSAINPAMEFSEEKVASDLESLNTKIGIDNVELDGDTVTVTITNQGSTEIKSFNVRVIGSSGVDVVPVDKSLDELETITEEVDFNLGKTGTVEKIEVVPVVSSGLAIGATSFEDLIEDSIVVGSSCLDILSNYQDATSGIYYIDPDGEGEIDFFQTYCDMDYDGGGWTLLMKATGGDTFNYYSNYWTTSNTLNEDDVNRNNADAKYDSFNKLEITDIMARWPDFDDIRWLENDAWTARTALQGFNEYRNWGIPQEDDNWNPTYFSAQVKQCDTGPGRYGTKLRDIGGYNAGARWGYRFNENGCGNWGSDDVGGGIGLWTDRNVGWHYSAGDWSNCCRITTGKLRSARVEVYGR